MLRVFRQGKGAEVASRQLAVWQADEERRHGLCDACPSLCRDACPVADAEARETVAPQRLVSQARWLAGGRLSAEDLGDTPWHCSDCGACTDACHHGQDVPSLLVLARHRMLEQRSAPESVREVCGNFAVEANPYGRSLMAPLESVCSRTQRSLHRQPTALLFPGCVALAEDVDSVEQTTRAASLFGDPDLGLSPWSAACCGAPLWWAGDLDGFRAHASRVAHGLQRSQVVVMDPACALTMTRRYAQVGIEPDFSVELAFDRLARLQPAGPEPHTGARLGTFEGCAEHRVPNRPEPPSRPGSTRESLGPQTLGCCGAGGLLPQIAPEAAEAMADRVVDGARERGLDGLVVPSVRCRHHLRSRSRGFPVLDPADLWVRA